MSANFFLHTSISCYSNVRYVIAICRFLDATTSTPAHWSNAANLEFLELLAAFCSQQAGLKPPTSTYIQWIAIFSAHHAFQYTVKQLQTRYQRFRKVYNLFMGMKNDLGLGWDEELQTV